MYKKEKRKGCKKYKEKRVLLDQRLVAVRNPDCLPRKKKYVETTHWNLFEEKKLVLDFSGFGHNKQIKINRNGTFILKCKLSLDSSWRNIWESSVCMICHWIRFGSEI